MKIIAIDSSGLVASVAVVSEDAVIAEYTVNFKKTHSQTLLPMLAEVSELINLDMQEVDAIAVTAGPGSFTGLRIGSATAKGLAFGIDKPIIAVPTVDAISNNLWGVKDLIVPIMDARREQVYTGFYEFNDKNEHTVVKEQFVDSITNVIEEINALGRSVVFLGDAVPVYEAVIRENIKVSYDFAPIHANRQRAAALGELAIKYYKEGKVTNCDDYAPTYLRLSQAERERQEGLLK